MAGVGSVGFLKEFASRLVPTLAFSSITPVMQLTQNPTILDTDEGRKEMLAMAGASILSGAVGAGLGTVGNRLGNRILPGPKELVPTDEVSTAFNALNNKSKLDAVVVPIRSTPAELELAYKTGVKNLGKNQKGIDELTKQYNVAKSTIGKPDAEVFTVRQMPSATGQNIGMVGDVAGGMLSWAPIYSAISGNSTNPVDPETVISPEDYTGMLQAQGYGSQEQIVHQQVANRLLQGDGLPYYNYSPGTMYNTSGLNPVDILGYDPTQV